MLQQWNSHSIHKPISHHIRRCIFMNHGIISGTYGKQHSWHNHTSQTGDSHEYRSLAELDSRCGEVKMASRMVEKSLLQVMGGFLTSEQTKYGCGHGLHMNLKYKYHTVVVCIYTSLKLSVLKNTVISHKLLNFKEICSKIRI